MVNILITSKLINVSTVISVVNILITSMTNVNVIDVSVVISLTFITMNISFNPQLLLERRLNKDSYVFKISTRKPCVADEIIIYILSKILGVSICVFFRNTLWTTIQNDEVDSCDLYYAYTGEG